MLNKILRFGALFGMCCLPALLYTGCAQETPKGIEVEQQGKCAYCHQIPMTSGAHGTHVKEFGCSTCHPGTDSSGTAFSPQFHDNGRIDVRMTSLPGRALLDSATYAPGTGCARVSCHGFGQPAVQNIVWASGTIAWSAESLGCKDCHDYTGHKVYARDTMHIPCYGCHTPVFHAQPHDTSLTCGQCHAIPPATGAHAYHADTLGRDCGACHLGYSRTGSSAALTTHMDGAITVNGPLSGTYAAAGQTCVNGWCHGNFPGGKNATIAWNGPAPACNACHELPPATGKHASHAAKGYDCGLCHLGSSLLDSSVSRATHADGVKTVNGPIEGGAYDSSGRSCAAVYCHGNFPGGKNATLQWYGPDAVCNTCHELPPSYGSHAGHNNASKRKYDCSLCHLGYSMTDSSVAMPHHINNVKDVDGAMGGGTFASATKTCASTYCHGNFTGGAHASPVWGGTAACGTCHSMSPMTGQHQKHRGQGFGCEFCHSGYVSGTTVNWTLHVNNVNNVGPFLNDNRTVNPTAAYSNRQCSNLNCHGTETW